MTGLILDAFAGPGGWSEGLRMLGLRDVGVELDADACATRRAAGHLTIRADVASFPLDHLAGKVRGVIASPPCQDWSVAGRRSGRGGAKGGGLVDEPLRWVEALRPEWVACEQVPPVLDAWWLHAQQYRELGYSAWCGIVDAAWYGVPQGRERAVLIASRTRSVQPPQPTHTDGDTMHLFGILDPWVAIEDVLPERAGWNLEHIRGAGMTERHGERPPRSSQDVSFTVLAHKDSRMRWRHPVTGEVAGFSTRDSLILQGFRPDYPVTGSQTVAQRQIGNAVPPPLAAHIVAAATGISLDEWKAAA